MWNLEVAIKIFAGLSFVALLLINRKGLRQLIWYSLFAVIIWYDRQLFYQSVSVLLTLLVIFRNGKITSALAFSALLLGASTIIGLSPYIYKWSYFLIYKESLSIACIGSMIILATEGKRNYVFIAQLFIFNIFWTAYAQPNNPLIQISMPMACLSLLLYPYMYVITVRFKGSIAYIIIQYLRHFFFRQPFMKKEIGNA